MIKDEITKAIKKASGLKNLQLEATENESFGDYSSSAALGQKSPRKFADDLVEKLKKDKGLGKLIDKIEVAGPGFINFWLQKDALIDNLMQILRVGGKYGKSDLNKGRKILFEYAHPNTHKAFHIGHLRNITTGETLCRLYEATGAEIIRANYQGDVGLHIAKAIWGILKLGILDGATGDVKKRAELLGKAYSYGATKYEEDSKVKEEIEDINVKIYNKSDQKINKIYQETRQWSLDYFDAIYNRVDTKFDRLYFESEVAENGKKLALKALKDGILVESEGAIIFPGSKYGLHDRVFISGKDVPTYEAKDLGLAELQFKEYNPELLVHTVGPEQSGYFQVLFKALELILPATKGKEVHVPYGWVRLKEGKMSSRTGNVILGESILNSAKDKIIESYQTETETAEKIAVGAVKYSFLKTGLNQDIAFDLKESISLEGNSGPYLQYTVARCNSVMGKAQNPKPEFLNKLDVRNSKLEIEELAVLKCLVRFSETITVSATNYSPNLLCNYLYELAQKYNGFYNKHKIIDSNNEEFRLALTFGVGQVLKNGLNLLGIQAPDRM